MRKRSAGGPAAFQRLRRAVRRRLQFARTVPISALHPVLAGIVTGGPARAPWFSPSGLQTRGVVLRQLLGAALWDECKLALFSATHPAHFVPLHRRILPHYGRALAFAWRALREGRDLRLVERAGNVSAGRTLEVDDTRDLVIFATDASVLTFAGRYRGQPAIFQAAADEPGSVTLRRQWQGLDTAKRACRAIKLGDHIAECLSFEERPQILVQQRLAGHTPRLRHRLRTLPEAEFQSYIAAAMEPLERFHGSARRLPDGPDQTLIFRDLPLFIERYPALAPWLGPALQGLQRWPARRGLAAVLVHGDYWLGNVLFDDTRRVSGIIDWERCRQSGCPGLDAIHLAAASYGVWCALPLPRVFEQIWTRRPESAFLRDHVGSVQALFALSDDCVSHLAVLLWLNYVRTAVLTMGWPPDEWLLHNVERPARSLGGALGRPATLPLTVGAAAVLAPAWDNEHLDPPQAAACPTSAHPVYKA